MYGQLLHLTLRLTIPSLAENVDWILPLPQARTDDLIPMLQNQDYG